MIYAFGDNEWGQLGLGHKGKAVLIPTPVMKGWQAATDIWATASHTVASLPHGLEFVGSNRYGSSAVDKAEHSSPIPFGLKNVRLIALGGSHGVALTAEGVRTWGGNLRGQLGVGSSSQGHEKLAMPGCTAEPQTPNLPPTVTGLWAGQMTVFALCNSGLWAWGWNEYGACGTGGKGGEVTVPMPVLMPEHHGEIAEVACGEHHTVIRLTDGRLVGMGQGRQGQLGPHTPAIPLPSLLNGVSDIVEVRAGRDRTVLRSSNGKVTEWGNEQPPTTRVAAGASSISCGGTHSLAVVDGEVWSWGNNERGQVGDGTREPRVAPVPIDLQASRVITGDYHSIAIQ